jgi:hypothetical protein
MRVDKEKRDKQNARALQLFLQGKSPLDVCIELEISADEAVHLYNDYLKLTSRYKLAHIDEELGRNLPDVIYLYKL